MSFQNQNQKNHEVDYLKQEDQPLLEGEFDDVEVGADVSKSKAKKEGGCGTGVWVGILVGALVAVSLIAVGIFFLVKHLNKTETPLDQPALDEELPHKQESPVPEIVKKACDYPGSQGRKEDGSCDFPKIVWILWLQGWNEDGTPKVQGDQGQSYLINNVRRTWVDLNDGWTVKLIDMENLKEIIPIDMQFVARSNPRPASKADFIRLSLLSRWGGVWADATMM